ncbi:precorrin-6A/cobalt-precorrin-6A reductase [Halospina denitrificans]|uniref:Precorrin-6A/cobalt-precorrin-6A reductase n=1 Tax=Halospina denitrificans TaxID=332522 RepID=A0A4R7JTX0_9GAMM|nr:cobalt-precorrin-6A reductase [Halospina denitrificans]TDT40349.1 precorrin-6A/cobalt-precorrin-6A reductase [Halospina denitrificans]
MQILILGGTRDAMTLADQLLDHPELQPIYSLAGRTRRPLPPSLPTRRGGFGGIEGLKQWLIRNNTAAVVDATHPFAAEMSNNAAIACQELGIPLGRLERPPWEETDDDHWIRVPDLHEAARQAEAITDPGATLWLTTGRTSLAAFEPITDRHLLVRCVDPPDPAPDFRNWTLIEDRGPYDLDDERNIITTHNVAALVTKNSGGQAARPKLDAAREAGIPVVIVDRPTLPPATHSFDSLEAVTTWLDRGLQVSRISQGRG